MKHEINTEIRIEATKEEVWDLLIDFEKYKEWNPFIERTEGDQQVGGKLFVRLGGMSFRPKVKTNVQQQEFSWLGRFIVPGLFDGNHIFILKENPDNSVTFIQKERFSGILVPLKKKWLSREVKLQFEAMNKALKSRVESNKGSN